MDIKFLIIFLLSFTFIQSQDFVKDTQNKIARTKNSQEYIRLLTDLGDYYDNIGDYNNSLKTYNQLLSYSLKNSDKFNIMRSYFEIGLAYDNKSNFDSASIFYNYSINLANQLNNKEYLIICNLHLSNIDRYRSEYDSAFIKINNSYELSVKCKNKNLIGNSLYQKGILYYKLKQFDESIKDFTQALNYFDPAKDVKLIASSFGYIGRNYSETNNLYRAIQYYLRALHERESINDVAGISISLNNLAEIYYSQGKYRKALNNYFESYKIRSKSNNLYGVAECQKNIARTYLALNNYNPALLYVNKSLSYTKKEKLYDLQKTDLLLLSNIYEKQKNYKQAYFYFKKYSELNDSISISSFNTQISALNFKYSIEKNEKQLQDIEFRNVKDKLNSNKNLLSLILITFLLSITALWFGLKNYNSKKHNLILEEKNKEISLQREELNKSNMTKDKLFSIIAHDLKNPFQALLGLSSLLLMEYDQLDSEERLNFIKEINNASINSYNLLENLLHWSRSQMDKIKTLIHDVNLNSLIKNTLYQVKSLAEAKQINIENNIEQDYIIQADSDMFEIVFRNFLTNAIKFTPNNGNILISCQIKDEELYLTIQDNGIGMDKESLENSINPELLNSTAGTNNEKGTGLGLILCKEFLEKMNMKFNMESSKDLGTKVIITITHFKTA